MQRATLAQAGWDGAIAIEGRDTPEPQGDQVLVCVEACGVCYRDCIDRDGRFAFMRMPITPGHEAAGRVIAVGPRADDWRVGDRVATMHRDSCGACDACKRGQTSLCERAASVLGLLIDGGYATHILAPQRCFYRSDDSLPAAVAAVLHCTAGTAYRGMVRFGGLGTGQRVLVTGANGGVGSAAVMLGRALGAEVIAVVRRAEHEAFVRECGAHEVIVDEHGDFHKQIGGSVDVALECVGKPTFNAALRSLRIGGRLVSIGNIVAERAELNLGYIITRALGVIGSSGATRADMAEVLAIHAQTPLAVPIHAQLPLARADEAQRMVRAGGVHGRIVLVPEHPPPAAQGA